jgi:hypothetical protein
LLPHKDKNMTELVYFSEANHDLKSEDVSNILKTARDFNSINNITGCLLYHNNEFLQILEGEKETVLDLFTAIKKDIRHSNVILIAEDDKNKRMFSDWNMAFYEFGKDKSEEKKIVNNIVAFSEIAEKPTHVIDLFWTMAKHIITN